MIQERRPQYASALRVRGVDPQGWLAVTPRDSGFQITGIVRSERRMEGKNQAAAFAGMRHVHAKERCRDGVAGGYWWICQLWSSNGTELTRVSLCVERATSRMFTCRHVGR